MNWPPFLLTCGHRRTITRSYRPICLVCEAKILLLFFADLVNLALQRQFIQSCQRQRKKEADPAIQHHKSVVERPFGLFVCALRGSGVGNAPMRRHGLPGPDWTYLSSGVIANGKYEIEMWRVSRGKLLPALAAVSVDGQMGLCKLPQCRRMHRPFRLAAST